VDDGGGSSDQRPVSEPKRLAERSVAAFEVAEATADPTIKADKLAQAVVLAGDSALAIAYTYLRQIVGIIAVLLPGAVMVGNFAFGDDELKGSISAYYYTPSRNWFVGSLCALAVFFLSYHHRPLPTFELDKRLSRLASVAALGVAFFPTAREAGAASVGEETIAVVHLGFAGLLFLLLGFFSLFLFTKSGDATTLTPQKQRRNGVYKICGIVIFVAIVCVPLSNVIDPPSEWHTLYWLETIAVLAFGVSWLVKGSFLKILADKPANPGRR